MESARSAEVLGAQANEIDLEKRLWTIPPERMKAGREHRVSWSFRTIEIVQDMQALGRPPYLCPGSKPKAPLSSMAMAMLLRRMKSDGTVRGFRSTFRDWASETTSFTHEVCEMVLAHTITTKAEAAYRRGDRFERRRKLMEAWAGYCASARSGKIVRLAASSQAGADPHHRFASLSGRQPTGSSIQRLTADSRQPAPCTLIRT
jgi:integrase